MHIYASDLVYAVIRRFVGSRSRNVLFSDTGSESQGQKKFFFKVSLICADHIRVFQVTNQRMTNRICLGNVLIDCLPARSSCSVFYYSLLIHAWELIQCSLFWCMQSICFCTFSRIYLYITFLFFLQYSQLLACAFPAALLVICVNWLAHALHCVKVHERDLSCIYCSFLGAELLHVREGRSFVKCVA